MESSTLFSVAIMGKIADEIREIASDYGDIKPAKNEFLRFAIEEEQKGRPHAFFRGRSSLAQAFEIAFRHRHLVVRCATPVLYNNLEL